MKILYLITKANWGGAQRYVFDLARAAKSEGFKVAVAYGGKEGVLTEKLEEAEVSSIQVPFLERDIGFLKEFKAIESIYQLLLKAQPDVLHLNSSKAGIFGAMAAKKYRKKTKRKLVVVFTAHGWAFSEANRSWPFLLLSRIGHRRSVSLADVTIAVSEKTREEFAQLDKGLMKKIQVIHNGIRPLRPLSKEVARQRLFQNSSIPVSSYNPWFGSIGELHQNKGYDLLLEAFAELVQEDPRFQKSLIAIIGSGEEGENLKKLISEKNLEGKVILLGQMEKASQYLPAFDFFLISSRKEGLPYVALEAASSGSLIVSSNTGGLSELIEDQKTGILFQARSKASLKNALVRALKLSSREREKIKRAALEKCKEDFSFSQMWSKTKRLYQELL